MEQQVAAAAAGAGGMLADAQAVRSHGEARAVLSHWEGCRSRSAHSPNDCCSCRCAALHSTLDRRQAAAVATAEDGAAACPACSRGVHSVAAVAAVPAVRGLPVGLLWECGQAAVLGGGLPQLLGCVGKEAALQGKAQMDSRECHRICCLQCILVV